MLNSSFWASFDTCTAFGAVFNAGGCGFSFDKFVDFDRTDVFAV
jgi:hypothetical protein